MFLPAHVRAREARDADTYGNDIFHSQVLLGDMGAGKNAGLAGGLLVRSGHGNDAGERAEALALSDTGFQVIIGDEVGAAMRAFPMFPQT